MRARPSISYLVMVVLVAWRPGGQPAEMTIDPTAGPPGVAVTATGDATCPAPVPDDTTDGGVDLRQPPPRSAPRLRQSTESGTSGGVDLREPTEADADGAVRLGQPAEAEFAVTVGGAPADIESSAANDDGFTATFEIPEAATPGTAVVVVTCDGESLGTADFVVEGPPSPDDPGPDPTQAPTPGPTGVPSDPDPVASSDWLLIAIALVIAALLVALLWRGRGGRAWVRAHVRVVAQQGAVGDEVRPVRSRDPASVPTVVVRLEPRADREQHVTLEEGR
jgi:hypothetical protein